MISSLLLVGCSVPEPRPCAIGGTPGIVDGRTHNPWPSMHAMIGGVDCRVSVPPGLLTVAQDGRDWDLAPFERRDGFSPVGTVVVQLGVALDSSSLPSVGVPEGSLADDAAVQVWDLDAGVRLRHFAEVDAHPIPRDEARVLLVRPLEHWGFGRRIGVVITDALRDVSGRSVNAPGMFAELRSGAGDRDDPVVQHYTALLAELEALGAPVGTATLAFDFRTATEGNTLAPVDTTIDAVRSALPEGGTPTVTLTLVRDAMDADPADPPPGIWREVRGSIALPHFLQPEPGTEGAEADEGRFLWDGDGLPTSGPVGEAFFTLIVPDSVREADPGTVPWLVFGHGLFRNPQHYLASADDPEDTVDLANRLGAIVIGTEWRGLTERDLGDAIRVARDPARFGLLTDKLTQAVANQLALGRLPHTDFAFRSFLAAGADASGGSLVDPSRVHYFGISLGGIEGPVVVANSEFMQAGVFHVPGAVWSTMLERSSNWTQFEAFIEDAVLDAADRQWIYAASQLLWDPVDPMNHLGRFGDEAGLWQVSMGDDQVPNFTAETLARSLGVPLLDPFVELVVGLPVAAAPLPPGGSRALVQFESLYPRPPDANRPAPETGSHYVPRHTEPMKEQIVAFFTEGREGEIIDPCGGPCVVE